MIKYDFVLWTTFKPYVRMTQRGKWVKKNAQDYLASKATLKDLLGLQMVGKLRLEKTPCHVDIIIISTKKFHNKDLDNQVKAILDAMNGVVFDDDRWVDKITAARFLANETEKDCIVIEVHELGAHTND